MENRCVVCGEIIPEGRQVCPNCEAGQKPERKKDDNEQKDNFNHDRRTLMDDDEKSLSGLLTED